MGLPWLSICDAVVISADLMVIGSQLGLALLSRAAMPAMCGLDIEVPDSALKLLPSLAGEIAAMTSTPGAVMSGFSRSPPPARDGPTDEKPAMIGARTGVGSVTDSDAVAPGVAAYALMASPAGASTCT